jgi:methionyl-tRNA synthetase
MGFDPLFVWGIVHVAMMMAHEGRYGHWDTLLVNEFYELDNEKFSSSKGHLVWARDLVAEVPRDIVRFYLCLSAPEHARTNFSRATLDTVARDRLVVPWNELAAVLAKLTAEAGGDVPPLPVSAAARAAAAAMVGRFTGCYELTSFSLTRAADLVVQYTARVRAHALRAAGDGLDRDALRARLGELFVQTRALVCGASPILIDVTARAAHAGGFELHISPDTCDVTQTTAFGLPLLELATAPDPVVSRLD